MPHSKSAAKRMRTDAKKHTANKSRKNQIKSSERKLFKAIEASDKKAVKENLSIIFSILDKAVKAGTIHKNKADRTKSRLSAACAEK